ncbi:MAG TPA: hypothetical protein VM661_02705 [Candidatus Sulfotelmatobacter sp.]|jgi:hypothetical protein|nr:hypothetical protein [Candidatus Sulfotelmatobacter sp.]
MFIWKSLQPSLIAKVLSGIMPPKGKPQGQAQPSAKAVSAK